jgi:hypothetical protein
MSPQDKRPARRSDDPDSTAELPVLADPNLADPDTWVGPPPMRGTLVDEVLQAHETEIQLLRRELAHSARERAAYERQYHEAISDREEMRQDLAGADARANELARQLNDVERTVEERDVRIGELQLDLDDAATAPAVAAADTAAIGTAAAARAAREEDAELHALRAELQQLRWRVAAQSEALQSREARRQVNESQWRELEAEVGERDARIRTLERELAALRGSAAQQPVAVPVAAPVATANRIVPLEAQPWPPPAAGGEPAGTVRGGPADVGPDPASPAQMAPGKDGAGPGAAVQRGADQAGLDAGDPAAAGQPDPGAGRAAGGDGQLPAGVARSDAAPAGDTGAFAATGDFASTGEYDSGHRGGEVATAAPVRMLVRTDGDAGIVHVLGRRTTIGRTPDNDLRINAEWISRHHAVVLQTTDGTVVEDLNSTNGVLVNGMRVARRQLEPGDLVTFGKSGFRYLVKARDGEPAR